MVRRRVLFIPCAVLVFLLSAFLFLAPFPAESGSAQTKSYLCVWADGNQTRESYSSAYGDLKGIAPNGNLLLLRGGVQGEIAATDSFRAATDVFEHGDLGRLYALDTEGVSALEYVCLWREYGERIYYDDGAFMWTGEAFLPADGREEGKELVLLGGSVASSLLKRAGVEKLILRKDAQLSSRTLIGTAVTCVEAEFPYSSVRGGVYLDTLGGKRLVAALPDLSSLNVEDCDFIDEGALLACENLCSLSLPFVGNSKTSLLTNYKGELAHLFQDGDEYRVPQTLTRVKVTGGTLVSWAFYACPDLEEIDACGVRGEDISYTAFYGLESLRMLHTPRRNVRLSGKFLSYTASCGCTIYEKV